MEEMLTVEMVDDIDPEAQDHAQGQSSVILTIGSHSQSDTLSTSRHNAPIEKVPPELLMKILLLTAASSDPFLEKDAYEAGRSWISITYVCQYWRSLALALPLLWGRIEIQPWNLGLANMSLVRSAQVPLHVIVLETEHAPFPEYKLRGAAQLLLPHNGRITCFKANLSCPNISLLSSLLLTEPAPMLASLDMSVRHNGRPGAIHVKNHFGEHLPSLRKLRINRIVLPQSPQLCSRLTVLQMINPPSSFGGIDTLASLFGETSGLLSLTLLFSYKERNTCSDPTRLVRLPFLQTLDLILHSQVMHHFFLHFMIPSTAMMNVHVMGKDDPSSSIFAESDMVASTMRNILKATFIFAKWLNIMPYDEYIIYVDPCQFPGCALYAVKHEWRAPLAEPFDISHVDLTIFNFPNLKTLSIDVDMVVILPAQWASILSALAQLVQLEVTSYDADLHLMQGLALQTPLRDGLLCPALKAILIQGGLCGKDNRDSAIQLALDTFEQRALRGSPVQVLYLFDKATAMLAPEHITRLQRVVALVKQRVI